jgi:hypothetical protein
MSANKSILVCRHCDTDISGPDVAKRVSTAAGPMHAACYQQHRAAVDAWFEAAKARGAWRSSQGVANA